MTNMNDYDTVLAELREVELERREIRMTLLETMPLQKFKEIKAQDNALIKRQHELQAAVRTARRSPQRTAEFSNLVQATGIATNIDPVQRRASAGHLRWCAAFTDCAKEMLDPEMFTRLRKEASRRLEVQQVVASEMALSHEEAVVLPLFGMLGMKRKRAEIWEQVLQRTDLNEKEMDGALDSLCARKILTRDNDAFIRTGAA